MTPAAGSEPGDSPPSGTHAKLDSDSKLERTRAEVRRIVAEFRRGYLVGDRVLRPALVAVSDGEEVKPGAGARADGDGVSTAAESDTPRAN